MREELPVNHDYDLIVVSVQHYQFTNVASFLADKACYATILIFNNFCKDPVAEAASLPQAQLAWGFPMAAVGFDYHHKNRSYTNTYPLPGNHHLKPISKKQYRTTFKVFQPILGRHITFRNDITLPYPAFRRTRFRSTWSPPNTI